MFGSKKTSDKDSVEKGYHVRTHSGRPFIRVCARAAGIVIFCLFFLPGLPVQCFGQNGGTGALPPRIRVGFPNQYGITMTDEFHAYRGYTYDYLKEIARYTGWRYEFREMAGDEGQAYEKMLKLMESGELDMIGGMRYDQELAGRYTYSAYPYMTSYLNLLSSGESLSTGLDDYRELPVIRVAFSIQYKKQEEALDRLSRREGLNVEKLAFETGDEALEALKEGRADLMLARDTQREPDTQVIHKFSPVPLYFIMAKNAGETALELGEAIAALREDDPGRERMLYEKYFGVIQNALRLSGQEKRYAADRGPLKTVVLGGMEPVVYMDEEKGGFQGISRGFMDRIAEYTGLEFEYLYTESWDEYVRCMEDGTAELALVMTAGEDTEEEKLVSEAYLNVPVMLVVDGLKEPGDLYGKRRAALIAEKDADQMTVACATVRDCLDAVREGRADYCYVNTYSAQYYLEKNGYDNLRLLPIPSQTEFEMSVKVLSGDGQMLLQILNKGIRSLSSEDRQNIVYGKTVGTGKTTLRDYIGDHPQEAVSIVLTVLAVILVLVVVFVAKDIRARREIILENQRYEQISELSDECMFQYDYLRDCLKLSERSALQLGKGKNVEHYIVESARLYQDKGLQDTFCEWLCAEQDGIRDVKINVMEGVDRWYRVVSKVLRGKNGSPVYAVGKLVDIQKEKEEKEQLVAKSEKDSLTNLYNAATTKRKIAELLEAREEGDVGALLIADVDKFKEINDSYGHFTGDQVLVAISYIFQSVFSEEDIKGRLGGDEFIIYIRHAENREKVEELCRSLKHACRQIVAKERQGAVSMSIGVVMVSAPGEFEEWYKKADKALYLVKECGRDNYEIM